HFAIGYTEPGAGTDLASLRTRAVRDGDQWVINGSKLFTSQAQYADYIWLAARTDPNAKKHDGISIFLVPTSSPGYKITPLPTMGDVTTNATYYEDVRVPSNALVGPENGGWWLIVGQLNHERVVLIPVGPTERFLEEACTWARATRLPDGRRVIDLPWGQRNLAGGRAGLEVLKLVNWRQAWSMARGEMNYAESSTVKVYGSEFYVEAYRLLLEVLGQAGYVKAGSPAAVLKGRLERMYRATLIMTFGAGTNEVQREIIAIGGPRMPRCRPAPPSRIDLDGFRIQPGAGSAARPRAHHLSGPRDAGTPEDDRARARLVRPRAVGGARQGQPARRRASRGRRRQWPRAGGALPAARA